MTYLEKLALVTPEVEKQILVAAIDAAFQVYGETPGNTVRRQLATRVLTNPYGWLESMKLVCVSAATGIADANLKAAVLSAWDALSGVEPT